MEMGEGEEVIADSIQIPDLVERVEEYVPEGLEHEENEGGFRFYDDTILLLYREGAFSFGMKSGEGEVVVTSQSFEPDEVPFELECAFVDISTEEKDYHLLREGSEGELTTTESAFDHLTQALNKAVEEYDLKSSVDKWNLKYNRLKEKDSCLSYLLHPLQTIGDVTYFGLKIMGAKLNL